jgi:hypothetical protein
VFIFIKVISHICRVVIFFPQAFTRPSSKIGEETLHEREFQADLQ